MFPRFVASVLLVTSWSSATEDSFVFGGCSQLKFLPNSPYEFNVNSILTSLVNSAISTSTSYNYFTSDTVHGLFQCRGDLPPTHCSRCLAGAVTRLGTLCPYSCGAALQLDGCFVKYDNATFLGVEDKSVVATKCGPSMGYAPDAVLDYLGASQGFYRVGGSGELQAVAQCVGDLSATQCQDCLSEAIGRLKTECGGGAWGDMYLAKCYARYSQAATHSQAPGLGKPGPCFLLSAFILLFGFN